MKTKVRCQCEAPALSFRYYGSGVVPVIHFDGVPEGTLHFKASDRQCDHCGKPICKDCGINVRREYPWAWDWKGVEWICKDCKSLLEEPSEVGYDLRFK